MKRVALAAVVLVAVLAAAVYSRQEGTAPKQGEPLQGQLTISQEAQNPWTNLKLNNDPNQFQFAVVTDRTGGHRAKIFARAVEQINLLQPEFVMSVGDLIEGYSVKKERFQPEWEEFNSYVNKLQMPFFYVPGNHDLTNKELVAEWGGRFGRKYYHFLYRGVLFLAINSEDPSGKVSEEQVEYFRKVLEENKNVRWTLGFIHKPIWTANDLNKNGWAAMEKNLAGRKYTMFCGHVHKYQKFVRQGMNYYQLATTGGGSRLRGPMFGEFDHITWITMKNDGPLMANLLLDGILPENLKLPDNDEKGTPERKRVPVHPFAGTVNYDGKPLTGATIRFYKQGIIEGKFDLISEGISGDDGKFEVSTYRGLDGIPEGEYLVTVIKSEAQDEEGEKAKNILPVKYASSLTTPLKITIKPDVKNYGSFEIEK